MARAMDCKDIDVLPQYSGTCSFNGILMALFYSQGCRGIMEAALRSNKTIIDSEILSLCKKLFLPFYNKDNEKRPEDLLQRLAKIDPSSFRPQYGLNSWFNGPNYASNSALSIRGILDHIYKKKVPIIVGHIHKIDYEERPIKYTLYDTPMNYDLYNPFQPNNFPQGTRKSLYSCSDITMDRPELVVIVALNIGEFEFPFDMKKPYNTTFEPYNTDKNTVINDVTYVLSSMTFSNFNQVPGSYMHAMAGITCNDERYIYNGWNVLPDKMYKYKWYERYMKEKPCKLFPYDWMTSDNDFCISDEVCQLPLSTTGDLQHNLCFNTRKGYFLYFLVRADLYHEKECPIGSIVDFTGECTNDDDDDGCPLDKMKSHVSAKCTNAKGNECPPGHVRSHSGDCIAKPSLPSLPPLPRAPTRPNGGGAGPLGPAAIIDRVNSPAKKPNTTKECPPGKMKSPISGNCIIDRRIKPAKKPNATTECSPGKMKSPISGNCIIKPAKKPNTTKECPPGKMISPISGNCIIDRRKKPAKKPNTTKECPPGKMKSPLSGNCIIDRRNKPAKKPNATKECSPGKMKSPISGNCIIDRRIKPVKKPNTTKDCPPGKMISPISGNCIIDRRIKPVKKPNATTECSPGKMIKSYFRQLHH